MILSEYVTNSTSISLGVYLLGKDEVTLRDIEKVILE